MERHDLVTFEYRFDKVLAALVYLASRPEVTNLDKKKAISLLFLADKAHLLRYGEPIFGDYYRALPYGIVPQETLDRLNAFGKQLHGRDIERLAESLELIEVQGHPYPIMKAKVVPDFDALSELELGALEKVVKLYGDKNFAQLKGPSHPSAWWKAWESKPFYRRAVPISYEDLFKNEPSATEGSLEQMIEDFETQRALSGR